MESGKSLDDDFGAFREEVLNAQWLPPMALQLGLQQVQAHEPATASSAGLDAEAFLRTVYCCQE